MSQPITLGTDVSDELRTSIPEQLARVFFTRCEDDDGLGQHVHVVLETELATWDVDNDEWEPVVQHELARVEFLDRRLNVEKV